jgi:uncharacterized membrane protein YfcA
MPTFGSPRAIAALSSRGLRKVKGTSNSSAAFDLKSPEATLPRVSQGLQIGGTGASNGPGSTELPFFLFVTFVSAFVAGLFGFAVGLVATSLWLYVLTPLLSATPIVAFELIVQSYSVWKLRHTFDGPKPLPFVAGAFFVPAGVAPLTWLDPPASASRSGFARLGAKGSLTAETMRYFLLGLPFVLIGTWLGLKLFGRVDEARFRKARSRLAVRIRRCSIVLRARHGASPGK